MYEMQGPCPASRRRPAGCPAALRFLASRQYQEPARSPGCPVLPASPGSPPAWFPSPAV